MPYTRKRAPRKRKFVKRKRVPTNKQLATRVKKLEHTEELKYLDSFDASVLTTTGFILHLTGIAQGDDFNQRVGEEVISKYLNMKLRLSKTASINSPQIRCIIFWDMQNNGVGPTLFTSTSLVEGLLDNAVITNTMLSPHNYRTKDRYHILWDKHITFNPDDVTANQTINYKKNIKLSGAKIKYGTSAGSIAATVGRALYFGIFGTTSSVTDVTPNIANRIWFTDS